MRPSPARRLHPKTVLAASLLLALAAAGLHAETRTLTDRQGRSLKAEVLSVDGDQVSIKRDDGQTFTLSLSTLSDDDQKALKAWAAQEAAKPKPLAPGALTVDLSRGKFDTEKKDIDVTLTTGAVVKNGRTLTNEKWGYSVTLTNHSSQVIDHLKAEYRLFATVDNIQVKSNVDQGLKKKAYKLPVDPLPAFGHLTFRTQTIVAVKSKYNGNIVAAKSGERTSRETLYGIWIRIYQGDTVVYEAAMPQSLQTTEKW